MSCKLSAARPAAGACLQRHAGECTSHLRAKFGILNIYRDGAFVAQAMVGAPPALVDALLRKPFTPPPGVPLDRMFRTKKVVPTLDAAAEENKSLSARLGGARSHIVVPMLKDDELIGTISIYRQEYGHSRAFGREKALPKRGLAEISSFGGRGRHANGPRSSGWTGGCAHGHANRIGLPPRSLVLL